jgi:hypothetical protein
MDNVFTTVIQTLITEQGKEVLFKTTKCKAFLADYTRGEYKKESRLLLQAVELGIAEAVSFADDIEPCKVQAVRKMQEEFFIAETITADLVDMLALVLRGKARQEKVCRNCGKELQREWKACPYCSTLVKDTGAYVNKKKASSVISSSGRARDGIRLVDHEDSTKTIAIYGKWRKEWKTDHEVVIPEKIDGMPVTEIGKNAFEGYNEFTSIIIPNSVTTIGESAFKRCSKLATITIPNSVTDIGDSAFESCIGLKNI